MSFPLDRRLELTACPACDSVVSHKTMNSNEILKRCTLCAQLDEPEFKAIQQIVSIRNLGKNEILFFQGDLAPGFFVLLDGKVRIYKSSAEGKEFTLHLIQPGQMFAEAVIFHGDHYPANCSALEDSTIAFFPKEQFIRLIKQSPEISLKMIAGLAAFVRDFNKMVEDLSLKEISERLAAYLLEEYGRHSEVSYQLDISKSELAHKLGTISATLSRNLRKFIEIGAIEVDGKNIKILDVNRLKSIADGEKL